MIFVKWIPPHFCYDYTTENDRKAVYILSVSKWYSVYRCLFPILDKDKQRTYIILVLKMGKNDIVL